MVGGNTNISSEPVDDSSSGDDQANSGDQNQIADPVATLLRTFHKISFRGNH